MLLLSNPLRLKAIIKVGFKRIAWCDPLVMYPTTSRRRCALLCMTVHCRSFAAKLDNRPSQPDGRTSDKYYCVRGRSYSKIMSIKKCLNFAVLEFKLFLQLARDKAMPAICANLSWMLIFHGIPKLDLFRVRIIVRQHVEPFSYLY